MNYAHGFEKKNTKIAYAQGNEKKSPEITYVISNVFIGFSSYMILMLLSQDDCFPLFPIRNIIFLNRNRRHCESTDIVTQ